jgi:hypothetical protein
MTFGLTGISVPNAREFVAKCYLANVRGGETRMTPPSEMIPGSSNNWGLWQTTVIHLDGENCLLVVVWMRELLANPGASVTPIRK